MKLHAKWDNKNEPSFNSDVTYCCFECVFQLFKLTSYWELTEEVGSCLWPFITHPLMYKCKWCPWANFLLVFFPHFRLWTWALCMDQITLLFLPKQGKNYCLQFRRLWTWSFLILQREDMLLRLVLPLSQFFSLSNISLQFIYLLFIIFFKLQYWIVPPSFSLSHSFPLAISLSVVSRVCLCLWLFGRGFGYHYSCGYVAMYVCRWV